MIDLSKPHNLREVLHVLDHDQAAAGYRAAMLAFMRLVEITAGDFVSQAVWRATSPHELGTPEDADAFAVHVYEHCWPDVTAEDRAELARQAREIADEYERAASARKGRD